MNGPPLIIFIQTQKKLQLHFTPGPDEYGTVLSLKINKETLFTTIYPKIVEMLK